MQPSRSSAFASRLCPSAPAIPGAVIIGTLQADGSLGYIRDRLAATQDFLDAAESTGPAAQRFRFGAPCQEGACKQWVDGECSLPGRIEHEISTSLPEPELLPKCSIRKQCRWFYQSGKSACKACQFVVTQHAFAKPKDAHREA
jgi:hypothetical protein